MRLHYRLGWLAVVAVARVLWGLRTSGTDWIPREGPAIVACNHVSNWDPIVVGGACNRELHYMAKGELFKNPLLAWLVRAYNAVPIRRGVLDRRALRAASDVLKNGGVLLMFPGGTRDQSGEVKDPKAGVGFIACMNEVPVVPAYITGVDTLTRAVVRKRRLEVAFGEPLLAAKAASSDEYRAFSQRVAAEIRKLRQEVEGL